MKFSFFKGGGGLWMNKIQTLSVEITDKCQLLCRHCSTEASPEKSAFLPIEGIKKVLYQALELGAKNLTLSGGEPLLHPRLFDILNIASNLNYKTNIYTSGILANNESISIEMMEKLPNSVNKIIFSLHSSDKNCHDDITGVKGSFEKTVFSLRCALNIGLNTEVHIVPMSKNYRDIPELLKRLAYLGIENVSLLRLVPQGRCLHNKKLLMSKKESQEFLQTIKKFEQKNKLPVLRKGAPYRYLFGEEAGCCSAGEDKILISPNGDIHPCEAFKYDEADSNVLEDDLINIWNNDKRLNKVRDLKLNQIEFCKKCEKVEICRAGCPGQRKYANKNMWDGPDPGCTVL